MAVVIETTLGDITVDLYLEQRPVTCLNFLKLCKMKYYNFNLFHTIRSGFIAQTGDPSGEGSGGASIFGLCEGSEKRFFSGEKMPKIRHTDTGLLSMVCTGDMMVGSQFFFTLGSDLDSLDGIHCVIGEVTEGHDVLRKLNDVICDESHRPYQDVRITHTVILEDPFNDPPGLKAPSRSPSPSAQRLKGGRIAPDEEIDERRGKSALEIQEIIEEKEAKARATILEIVGDIPDADIAPPENVLFVCKLNPVTTDEDLEIIFSRFGKINSCEVIRDKKSGDSLQYAFVEFDDKKSCEEAYFKMDNVLIDDRRIHVDFSQSVSKIKWLGKGRGVKHINDDNIVKDNHKNNQGHSKRPKSRDRSDKNRRDKDHHRDLDRYSDRTNHKKDQISDRERSHERLSSHRSSSRYKKERRDRTRSRSRKRSSRPIENESSRTRKDETENSKHRKDDYDRSRDKKEDRKSSKIRNEDKDTSRHKIENKEFSKTKKDENDILRNKKDIQHISKNRDGEKDISRNRDNEKNNPKYRNTEKDSSRNKKNERENVRTKRDERKVSENFENEKEMSRKEINNIKKSENLKNDSSTQNTAAKEFSMYRSDENEITQNKSAGEKKRQSRWDKKEEIRKSEKNHDDQSNHFNEQNTEVYRQELLQSHVSSKTDQTTESSSNNDKTQIITAGSSESHSDPVRCHEKNTNQGDYLKHTTKSLEKEIIHIQKPDKKENIIADEVNHNTEQKSDKDKLKKDHKIKKVKHARKIEPHTPSPVGKEISKSKEKKIVKKHGNIKKKRSATSSSDSDSSTSSSSESSSSSDSDKQKKRVRRRKKKPSTSSSSSTSESSTSSSSSSTDSSSDSSSSSSDSEPKKKKRKKNVSKKKVVKKSKKS